MQTKYPVAALVIGAALIALIAGVTGWSVRARSVATSNVADAALQESAPAVGALPSDRVDSRRVAPVQIHNGRPDPRRLLMDRSRGTSESVAVARKKLQSQFTSEPVDKSWAAHKQTALTAANDAPQIEELGAKPLAFDSQCHSSVCLIAADFPSTTAADDWFSLYTLVAGPEMSRAAVQRSSNPDGTIHLQIYGLAR